MPVSIYYITIFIVSALSSLLFSAAILSIWSISRDSLQKLIENKVRGASQLYRIIRNKNRFQHMLVSGRVFSLLSGAVSAALFAVYLADGKPDQCILIYCIVLITAALIFTFTENILARLVSLGEYEDIVPRFAWFLAFFFVILYPLTLLLSMIHAVFIKEDQVLAAKEDALIEFVKSENEAGVIEDGESEMIQDVLDFFDTTVREVMVPRIDMVAVEKGTPVDEAIKIFKEHGHSRIPVYEERIDNILGVVYAKDLLIRIADSDAATFALTDIMREAFFVHETKIIPDMLADFKANKVHIAVVVDEYGGTAGIVALEDLLEEIVGEISDEYDNEERNFVWVGDTTVVIDAGLDIDDVNDIIHTDIPSEDFDTLGGFVYTQLGVIPKGGEEFLWEEITFTVKKIVGNRISKVLVTLKEPLMKDEDVEE